MAERIFLRNGMALVAAIIFFCSLTRVALCQATSKNNLLINGGFEQGVPELQPSLGASVSKSFQGWNYRLLDDQTYIWPESKERAYSPSAPFEYHHGNEAVRLAALRAGSGEIFQDVSIEPDLSYRASVWVRTIDADGLGFGTNIKDSAELIVSELDRQGNVIVEHQKGIAKANREYQQLTITFRAGPNTVKLRFTLRTRLLCGHWHGRVKYDDCTLEKMN
jgi:hypothetical protein